MSKKELPTEITEHVFRPEEIRNIEFTHEYLLRKKSETVLGEIHFFAQLGLINNSFMCPTCLNRMKLHKKLKIHDRYAWVCQRPCRKEVNIRSNSIFEGIKAPMSKFFSFLFMWSTDSQNQDIARENKLSKNTITSWCFTLRETLQDHLLENRDLLGGHDEYGRSKVVEIDESLFFRRKYNRGRYTGASWVFGMVERGSTNCAFFPVPDRSAATLLPLIRDNCLPGTTIISDCWAAYNALSQDPNFEHMQVNHSYNFVSPDNPIVHTQNIENCWSHSKRASRNQFGVRKNDLEGFFFEFAFKKKFPRYSRINQMIIIFSDLLRE